MEQQIVDFTKVLTQNHERKWVALSKDNKKVVDYDVDLVALDRRVKKDEVIFMKVPASDIYLSL